MKDTYESNNYGPMEIVKYTNAKDVLVRFIETGYETSAHMQSIRAGHVTDHSFKTRVTEARRTEKLKGPAVPEDMRAGVVHTTEDGEAIMILEYESKGLITALFESSNTVFKTSKEVIRKGRFRDPSIVLRERATKSERLIKELRMRCEYDQDRGIFTRKEGFTGIAAGQILGSEDSSGKLQATIAGARVSVSSLVWLVEHGALPSGPLHHKDGVNSNNRFSNLEQGKQSIVIVEGYTPPAPAPAPAPEQDEQDTTGYRTEAARLLEEINKIGKRLQARGVRPL